MGMTVSSLVMVQGAVGEDGKAPARPYTPITTDDQLGYFELMVKGYPTGKVSKYLCSLKPGDTVHVKGPFPKLSYKANMKKQIGMVAGGSGITPMVQVLKEILNNPDDKTCVTLIYGNQTPSNIPLRAELEDMASNSNGRLKVLYVVDKNDTADTNIFHVGYVTAEVVAGVLPRPSEDTLVYVCGPPGMLKAVAGDKKFEKGKPPAQGEVGGILKELGYSSDMVFKF
jgi:cytochrome-b5 reductase